MWNKVAALGWILAGLLSVIVLSVFVIAPALRQPDRQPVVTQQPDGSFHIDRLGPGQSVTLPFSVTLPATPACQSTIAALPTCEAGLPQPRVKICDGADANDCTVGGGNTEVECVCDTKAVFFPKFHVTSQRVPVDTGSQTFHGLEPARVMQWVEADGRILMQVNSDGTFDFYGDPTEAAKVFVESVQERLRALMEQACGQQGLIPQYKFENQLKESK